MTFYEIPGLLITIGIAFEIALLGFRLSPQMLSIHFHNKMYMRMVEYQITIEDIEKELNKTIENEEFERSATLKKLMDIRKRGYIKWP